MNFKRISVDEAQTLIDAAQRSQCSIVDVRDANSFQNGHLPGAVNVDNSSLAGFLEDTDANTPLLVYCYHGNMSQGAAAYFADQGFSDSYSMDGGYDAWLISNSLNSD